MILYICTLKLKYSSVNSHLSYCIDLFFQENQVTASRNNNINHYYESLRNNVITLLEHVRLPANNGSSEKPEHFDSYISKLQSFCTTDTYRIEEIKPIYETMRSNIQDGTMLSTPI